MIQGGVALDPGTPMLIHVIGDEGGFNGTHGNMAAT